MTVRTLLREDRRYCHRVPTKVRPESPFEALDMSDIAELSTTAINNMSCDELVRVIRVAGLPDQLCPNLDKRLPFYDHTTLTRLAHLAR